MGIGKLTKRLGCLRMLLFPASATTEGRLRTKTPEPGASLRQAKRHGLASPPKKGFGQEGATPTIFHRHLGLKGPPCRPAHLGGRQTEVSDLRRTERRSVFKWRVVHTHDRKPLERGRGHLPEGPSEHAYSSIGISFPEIALQDRPREFLAATSLTHEEFARVLPAFAAAYAVLYPPDKTWEGKVRQRQSGGGAKGGLPQMADKLFFILVYQKTNPLQTMHGLQFELS